MDTDRLIVERHWSKTDSGSSEKNFYLFPPLRARACWQVFGRPDLGRRDWCEYWTVEQFLKDRIPVGRCLSICCGFGEIERILFRLNVARSYLGIDVAPGAIVEAQARALQAGCQGIDYRIADLNEIELPAESFELIWANGALHHLSNLESVVDRLYKALAPGGMLVSNEYIGPDYQQLSLHHQELISALRHFLPDELRFRSEKQIDGLSVENIRFGRTWKMELKEDCLKTDPSECVRSSDILNVLNGQFDNVDTRFFHGSLLKYALGAVFFENFDPENEQHARLLEMMFRIEDDLIAAGVIPQVHAHIICRKS
jgi:SAM-dependent methyltransferase